MTENQQKEQLKPTKEKTYHLPFFPSRKCLYIKQEQEQDQEIYQEKKEIIKESEIAFFATFPPKFSTFQQTFNKVFNNN